VAWLVRPRLRNEAQQAPGRKTMFGRKKNKDFDEILKRYFPRSEKDEIKAARDRFLMLVKERRTLQEALDNFRTPEPVTDSKWVGLGYVDQLVLTAIYLLRGEGTSLRIDEKVNDLTSHVVDTGAVFISLDRLERGRLISSRPQEVEGYDKPQLVFSLTAEGKRRLSAVKAGAKRLLETLADVE
jgi:Transcriptional regulator PadR-like family